MSDVEIKIPTYRVVLRLKQDIECKVYLAQCLACGKCSLDGILKEMISMLPGECNKDWIINSPVLGILEWQSKGQPLLRENPGHYNHEESEVKWAYIHRASKIFWFLLSLWDSFWRLFWGVNVYLHFTKIKIKCVYFSMDTYTCRHKHTLRYFFP